MLEEFNLLILSFYHFSNVIYRSHARKYMNLSNIAKNHAELEIGEPRSERAGRGDARTLSPGAPSVCIVVIGDKSIVLP